MFADFWMTESPYSNQLYIAEACFMTAFVITCVLFGKSEIVTGHMKSTYYVNEGVSHANKS